MKQNNNFNHLIIMLFLIFTSCKTSLNSKDKNFILWQNSKQLTFKDFKGSKNIGHELLGHCATQYRFEHKIDEKTKIPIFTIKCYFKKRESFIKIKNDTLTLRHEQIHFNISELFCRRVRKSWDSLNILKEKKLAPYNKERNRIRKEIILLNNLFDKEEKFINGPIINDNLEIYSDSILKKWELRIEKELNSLQKYSNNDYSSFY